ncbi:hypothetical protein ABZP36_021567 [Zizania latifolia]
MRIAEEVIGGMRFPLRLLNLTMLTNFRKNGHPSVKGKAPAASRRGRKQDCRTLERADQRVPHLVPQVQIMETPSSISFSTNSVH